MLNNFWGRLFGKTETIFGARVKNGFFIKKGAFDQFNNITENHTNNDPNNVVECRYYDTEEIQTLNIPNKNKSLSMFHINTCSLSKNLDDLEYLLKTTNMNFDIISETRITKNINKIKWFIKSVCRQTKINSCIQD